MRKIGGLPQNSVLKVDHLFRQCVAELRCPQSLAGSLQAILFHSSDLIPSSAWHQIVLPADHHAQPRQDGMAFYNYSVMKVRHSICQSSYQHLWQCWSNKSLVLRSHGHVNNIWDNIRRVMDNENKQREVQWLSYKLPRMKPIWYLNVRRWSRGIKQQKRTEEMASTFFKFQFASKWSSNISYNRFVIWGLYWTLRSKNIMQS